MTDNFVSALDGVKVLDLTEERGLYAGKMLADLGAEVTLIEKPGGGKARQTVPFKDDKPGTENSLSFLYFNTNKRGITLDLDKPAGQDIFKHLVKRADMVIEDGEIGRMHSLGLDYPVLQELNRGIIMASVTGFGQTGPYRNYKAPDIVSFAMGGTMNASGPPNEPPIVAPSVQSYYSASVVSVYGMLAALFLRMSTGEGQLVDVSAHEAMAIFSANALMTYSNTSQIARRNGSQFGAVPGRIFPCADGHVHILTIRPYHWQGFLDVLKAANPDMSITGEEWTDAGLRMQNVDIIDAHTMEFTMTHNKMEIAELLQAKEVPCTPVNTPAEFCQDPHIKERGFIIEIEHPVIGRHGYFSPPYRLSKTPCSIRRPAPLLGQHNREVYCGELGYNSDELAKLTAEGII